MQLLRILKYDVSGSTNNVTIFPGSFLGMIVMSTQLSLKDNPQLGAQYHSDNLHLRIAVWRSRTQLDGWPSSGLRVLAGVYQWLF